MKTYRGSRGIAPLIPSLGTRWWGVVSFTPRPLYHRRKNPRYPWSWKVGGLQSRFGCSGKDKNLLLLPGIEHRTFHLID